MADESKLEPLPLNVKGEKVSPDGASWLVYDVETVLDPDVDPPERGWKAGLGRKGAVMEETEDFPSPPQCQVVSIGACALGEDLSFQRLILFGRGLGESPMVWDFARYVKENPTLGWVTFNGRGFDVPVLAARLFRHGWQLPVYFNGPRYGLRHRYSGPEQGSHIDLCDQLADYGGGRKSSLKHWCQSIGLPGKLEADGSTVASWYAEKKLEEIDRYCLLDVVQEALLFQRFMLLCGLIERRYYKQLVKDTVERLAATPWFSGFVQHIDRKRLFLEEV